MEKKTNIGIIGIGVVGNAILQGLQHLGIRDIFTYDKYKDENTNIKEISEILHTNILFLCLPTEYSNEHNAFDKTALTDTLEYLNKEQYNGFILIKSTVEPQTIDIYTHKFKYIKMIHNPEYLRERCAVDDFLNQKKIVLGMPKDKTFNIDIVKNFYDKYFPQSKLIITSSLNSELQKISLNAFASVKIQFLTELYMLAEKLGTTYNEVKNLLLESDMINPCHTDVPGPDGKISFGGKCLCKDSNALVGTMAIHNVPNLVLLSAVVERNKLRND